MLAREEYERLTALAAEAEEDAGAAASSRAHAAHSTKAARSPLRRPSPIASRLAKTLFWLSVTRRGITQVALANTAGMSQGYVADLQSGRRGGSPKQLAAVAAAPQVPFDLLVT